MQFLIVLIMLGLLIAGVAFLLGLTVGINSVLNAKNTTRENVTEGAK